MEYQFSQHVTREDYIAFLMNHLKINMFKPLNIVFFAIGIGYLASAPFITGTEDFTFTYIGLALVLIMIGSVLLARRNAGKRYDKNPSQYDMTYIVSEEHFTYVVADQTFDTSWMDFYSAIETEHYFYIYSSKDQGSLLIKREMSTETVAFIRQQLVLHISPKRVKLYTEKTTNES